MSYFSLGLVKKHAKTLIYCCSYRPGPEDAKLEGIERSRSRSKKIRKVDVSNPLSTFRKQVRQKKKYLIPSKFAKEEWL